MSTRQMSARQETGRRVAITGRGVLCALGDSPEHLSAALLAGRRSLGTLELLAANRLPQELPREPVGEIRDFDPRAYLGDGNLRPLDRASQLAASAVSLALDDGGWGPDLRAEHELGLALGTMFGSVRTIAEFDRRALTAGPKYAQPMVFANTVINAPAGQTAIWHRLPGINSTLAGGTTAGLQALAYATEQIRGGGSRAMLAGGSDELCFESLHGFASCGWMAGTGANGHGGSPRPTPFDARRNGFAPAEGAAFLVLEDADLANDRGARPIAWVEGHAASYDPSGGTDPASAGAALEQAIYQALADAGLVSSAGEPRLGAVDVAFASADGGPLDAAEAAAIAAACGAVPTTSVQACLGQTLGASSALSAVALLETFAAGELPGVPGLEAPDPGIEPGQLSAASRAVRVQRGLLTSLSRDGNACALVIASHGEE